MFSTSLSRFTFLFLLFSSFRLQPSQAQTKYQPSQANQEARQWFQDAKFGLFIHWGVYSILGDGEWIMNQRQIPIKDYERLSSFFNPTEFDAKAWVSMAKAAGMKYITITSKHHDGFAMYDSQVSDYDIMDRTPYKKDVLKMLADECQKQGIKLFFYYSQLDWHQPDYFPRGSTGGSWTGRPESGDWKSYLGYMNTQLKELLTKYGPVAGIWFDGMWDKSTADWELDKTYSLIHSLQPAALVGSNHHLAPFPGEDFQMFEKDLPGRNTAGFSGESQIGNLPLETCETMNNAWGFNIKDGQYKSTKNLIHYLVKAAGSNANFLLNVGPMPNGKIQPEFIQTLSEVGKWTEKNGASVYGTHGGPVAPHEWGVTTARDNKVYVHILQLPDYTLWLPGLTSKIRHAHLFGQKTSVKFTQSAEGVLLHLPAQRDELDMIIELELSSLPEKSGK